MSWGKWWSRFEFCESSKWRFPKMGVPPKSWILIGCSIINHPFIGVLISGNPQVAQPPKVKADNKKLQHQMQEPKIIWDGAQPSHVWGTKSRPNYNIIYIYTLWFIFMLFRYTLHIFLAFDWDRWFICSLLQWVRCRKYKISFQSLNDSVDQLLFVWYVPESHACDEWSSTDV